MAIYQIECGDISTNEYLKMKYFLPFQLFNRFRKLKPYVSLKNIIVLDFNIKSLRNEVMVCLNVTIGSYIWPVMFVVLHSKDNFNMLLGLHGVGVVPSSLHQKVFFWNWDEHLKLLLGTYILHELHVIDLWRKSL